MTPPTAASLRTLRESLPLWSDQQTPSAGWLDYCRYYGLDFSDRYPQAEYRAGAVVSGPYRIATHRWCSPTARSNLLVLHGYSDHCGLFDHMVAHGLAQNCNVLIFDLPGHGLSTGEPAAIADFGEYAQALADVLRVVTLPKLPLWALGQSTGCAVLMEFARRSAWPFEAAVLLAPLLRPAGWQRLQLAHRVLHRFVHSVPRTFSRNSSDQSFLDFIQQDPLQVRRYPLVWIGALRRWLAGLPMADLGVGPALVLQGDQDGTVDWRYNTRQIDTLFPGSDIRYLEGAGHQLANESSEIRSAYLADVAAYVEKRLEASASGG